MLSFLTDDEDCEDESEKEEVIDLHDNIDDEDSNMAPDDVAYDSEENEIEFVDDNSGKKKSIIIWLILLAIWVLQVAPT